MKIVRSGLVSEFNKTSGLSAMQMAGFIKSMTVSKKHSVRGLARSISKGRYAMKFYNVHNGKFGQCKIVKDGGKYSLSTRMRVDREAVAATEAAIKDAYSKADHSSDEFVEAWYQPS